MIVHELFNQTSNDSNTYMAALRINAHQMNTFITTQSKLSSDLPFDKVISLQEMYHELSSNSLNIERSNTAKYEQLHELYMRKVRELCVSTWVQFDVSMMTFGVMLLLLHLILVFGFLKGFIWIRHFSGNWIDLASFIVSTVHSVALFSNSLIVNEGAMITFLIQSLILILLVVKVTEVMGSFHHDWTWWECIMHLGKNLYQFILLMICVRMSLYFHSCRDQQDDCLIPPFLQKPNTSDRIILYIVQFFVSYLAFTFTLFYGAYFLGSAFGQQHKHFLISKWGYWFLRCSLLSVFVCLIPLPDIIHVYVFWMTAVGATVIFCLALMFPYYCQRKIVLRNHMAMVPYSWLIPSLWVIICLLIKCTNQVLLIPLSLSIIQLVLTIKTVRNMSQGSFILVSIMPCSFFVC